MSTEQRTTQIQTYLKNIPVKTWVITGVIFAVAVAYSLIFFLPKGVQFTYGSVTCVPHLLLAPQLQQTSSDDFNVIPGEEIKIGSVAVASTSLCFEPKHSLSEADYTVRMSPFGGWLAALRFTVAVPPAPSLEEGAIAGRAISPAQPLTIPLTSRDLLHTYTLTIHETSTICQPIEDSVSCEVADLGLKHGTAYTAALYRSFQGEPATKLTEGQVTTLTPLKQKKASVKNKEVIYTIPKEFTMTFDQELAEISATLERVEKDKTTPISLTSSFDNDTAHLKLSEALPRQASYRLTVNQAIAKKGHALDTPIVLTFSTSGGPKVKSVSVGQVAVAQNAQITVTLDQPLDESVDISQFARIAGVAGSVKKESSTKLVFQLRDTPRCAGFTLSLNKGLKSGVNNETSADAWQFNSRTVCGYSWVIGYSVRGRPIIAYSFGTGTSTILFTAGIHGSEPSSTSTMQAWANHLMAYGNVIPANKRVVIVPNTNPDAIAVGSRNNARNVNVGRNFPTANWKADIETANGVLKNGGGKSAGSEPEAKALIALTRQLRPRLEVSFHAQGSLVGANKFADSVRIGDIYAKTVGYRTMYYNAEAVMGYPMTGEYEDWMGEEMNIPAILIELPTASGNYLGSQLTALLKMVNI